MSTWHGRRFTVQWRSGYHWSNPAGWVVYDNKHHRIITISFPSFDEAERRRDNIARLYLRFGW